MCKVLGLTIYLDEISIIDRLVTSCQKLDNQLIGYQ
jgi:hypothetical protein